MRRTVSGISILSSAEFQRRIRCICARSRRRRASESLLAMSRVATRQATGISRLDGGSTAPASRSLASVISRISNERGPARLISLTWRIRAANPPLQRQRSSSPGAFMTPPSREIVYFYEIDDCYDMYARGPELDWPDSQVPVRKLPGERGMHES